MLIIHGDKDELVTPQGSRRLYESAASKAISKLRTWPQMLHAPLCELEPVRTEVEQEMCQWIQSRLQN